MNVYNIRMKYKLGNVSSAESNYCRITAIDENSWHYSFEDALWPLVSWDYDEPLLRLEELRDASGAVTHLRFTIDSWQGTETGDIVWGTNELPVWSKKDLEWPLARNAGKTIVISIGQIENPTVIKEEPQPEPSWWDKLGFFGKGMAVGGGLLCLGLLFWKAKK